ncbi:twin-arginine translocase subunit TatC [Methanolobus sp. ZRKC3]|uniref:twin-arginine translocase subunit TatC n=1 Tax=Methanolobus sp. ZRKC3 TaxID=3125786 RepID=UPI0032542058
MENDPFGNPEHIKNKVGVDGDYIEPAKLHLKELRNRFIRIVFAMFVFIAVFYPFSESIIQHAWNMFIGAGIEMTIYSPLEWMFTKVKVSFLLALACVFPLFFYEMFRFAARGMYPNERRFIKSTLPVSFVFFIFGVTIALVFIMPLMFDYIILSSDTIADNQISVKQTISVAITLMAGFGLVFQVPVLMYFATRMGIIQKKTLRKMRILVYASLLTFALFLSPDPTFIAQLVSAALLIVLFEIGLLISR